MNEVTCRIPWYVWCATMALISCDQQPRDEEPVGGDVGSWSAALSRSLGTATDNELRLEIGLEGRANDRPIRRAVVQVIEPITGTTLESFEQHFALGEVDGSLPLTLPRSFDAIAVRLDILAYDDREQEWSTSIDLKAWLARELPAVAGKAIERTEAGASRLDRSKFDGAEKEAP